MKIFHFSDTHLGFSEYNNINPETGLNQREKDFYDAWWQAIDAILATKPDVVVHAGDLFHTPRPNNRAIRVALEGIQKISDAGIPMVMISGNHSTPRIRSTGSIFESISLFQHVFAAFSSKYERFRIKDTDFHCVPHCSISEQLEDAFNNIKITDARFNVLITHGAWAGKQTYSMGEFNEHRLPDIETKLGIGFDYIALGHYHRRVDIKEHVCYSGSTERTSLNEHNSTCGYLVVDLDSKEKIYHEIKTRPMIKLNDLDCKNLKTTEIYKALRSMITPELDNAIVSLRLINIQHATFVQLDSREVDKIFDAVFHLEKRFESLEDDGTSSAGTFINALPVEFERFIHGLPDGELDKERLKKMGLNYLNET